MKKVLIINANPKPSSLCRSLADHYSQAAASKHDIKQVHVGDMSFDMNLNQGYDVVLPLEPDLVEFQTLITWAEHIVIISPVWWGTVPAKFKGAIDRAFLPGFAFQYLEGKSIPLKLLKGRTSELIITLDTPPVWYKLAQGNPIYKHLKHTILDFSGIKNRSSMYLGPVINADEKKRVAWFKQVEQRARSL